MTEAVVAIGVVAVAAGLLGRHLWRRAARGPAGCGRPGACPGCGAGPAECPREPETEVFGPESAKKAP